MKASVNDNLLIFSLLFPAMLVLFTVLLFPILSTLLLSFGVDFGKFDFNFLNYTRLLTDLEFWQSLSNTLIFVLSSVSIDLILGLAVALLLNQSFRGKPFFRVLALLPWMIPSTVTGVTWRWMYNPVSGIVNRFLQQLGLVTGPIMWLSSPSTALFSVIVANIWRGFPYVMLALLAGLQTISHDIYEAGAIDGANVWQRFFYLTLPSLKKTIIVVLALTMVWEFRQIDLIMTMTGGGPGRLTDVLTSTIYKQYFQFFQYDYASACAVVMSIVMLIVSIPYIKGILKD
jgi:multiple sugar transport system permease protein